MGKSQYIITITRQFGSMGRPIAKKMAEMLGIEFYDRDIVDQAAKKLNLPVSTVEENEESAQSKTSYGRMMFPLGINHTNDVQDQIFEAQENIIRFLAEKETCIIVGRCADFILKDMPNVIDIYIYAPYDVRLKHCVEDLEMDESEGKKMIIEVDRARDAYHMRYAGFLPGDPMHKDIMIDSNFLGVDGTAKFLVEAVKTKFPEAFS